MFQCLNWPTNVTHPVLSVTTPIRGGAQSKTKSRVEKWTLMIIIQYSTIKTNFYITESVIIIAIVNLLSVVKTH